MAGGLGQTPDFDFKGMAIFELGDESADVEATLAQIKEARFCAAYLSFGRSCVRP